MTEAESPRFVVQQVRPGARRRRWIAILVAVLVALAVGALAGYAWAPRSRTIAAPAAGVVPAPETTAKDPVRDALAQQVANLKQSAQVADVAAKSLRRTLADREEEISALRADLAFYTRLVGSGERQHGLVLHSVHVAPIKGSRAWNVNLILTESANRGKENHGQVTLAIEGVAGGKLTLLSGDELGGAGHDGKLPYRFKYFQQLHATVMLPEGFIPNRLRVTIKPDGGDASQHTVTWTDALKPVEENNVQQ